MLKLETTIIGAGNGGRAFAAYLAHMGHPVNLCYRTEKNIHHIRKTNVLESHGEIEGTFKLSRVTERVEDVVPVSSLILITLPAHVHEAAIKRVLPYLQNGQIILLNPGRTFGAIHAQSIIQKERPDLNVFVGETQTLLFTCRKIKDTGVFINKIKERVSYCFFPETDNELARGLMEELFPSLVPVDDILITSMNNIGAMVHPAGVLLNAGAIARAGQFEFYRQGMTREISRVIEAIDKERCLIVQRLGLPATTFLDWIRESYGVKARTVHEAFNVVMAYQGILAPDQLDTRYLLEDIPTGLVPMSSIGKMLRVDTPNIDAVIVLASALLGQDFTSTGRTLERVGFPLEILIRSALDTSEYTPSGKFWI